MRSKLKLIHFGRSIDDITQLRYDCDYCSSSMAQKLRTENNGPFMIVSLEISRTSCHLVSRIAVPCHRIKQIPPRASYVSFSRIKRPSSLHDNEKSQSKIVSHVLFTQYSTLALVLPLHPQTSALTVSLIFLIASTSACTDIGHSIYFRIGIEILLIVFSQRSIPP
jgi:hypothetical protein